MDNARLLILLLKALIGRFSVVRLSGSAADSEQKVGAVASWNVSSVYDEPSVYSQDAIPDDIANYNSIIIPDNGRGATF